MSGDILSFLISFYRFDYLVVVVCWLVDVNFVLNVVLVFFC